MKRLQSSLSWCEWVIWLFIHSASDTSQHSVFFPLTGETFRRLHHRQYSRYCRCYSAAGYFWKPGYGRCGLVNVGWRSVSRIMALCCEVGAHTHAQTQTHADTQIYRHWHEPLSFHSHTRLLMRNSCPEFEITAIQSSQCADPTNILPVSRRGGARDQLHQHLLSVVPFVYCYNWRSCKRWKSARTNT